LLREGHAKKLAHGIRDARKYQGADYCVGYPGQDRSQARATSGWRLRSFVLVLLSGLVLSFRLGYDNRRRRRVNSCL
jgi:hypothetical protein